ncbi:MAG: peroxidase family protein [Verrucomicrobiales bacterium]
MKMRPLIRQPRAVAAAGVSLILSLGAASLRAQTKQAVRTRTAPVTSDQQLLLEQAFAPRAVKRPSAPQPAPPPPIQSGGQFQFPAEFRTIDGTSNNSANSTLGSAGTPMIRLSPADYADGSGSPAGADRASAREVSNAVCAASGERPNARGASDFIWQWGQFVDHDIDETPTLDPPEAFDVAVPAGDPYFDPFNTGAQVIGLNRSYFELIGGRREQFNAITAFIDASNVYGSDEERSYALRTLDGTGKLRMTGDTMPPLNDAGFPNAPASSANFYLAGDVRANEQIGLLAMHTLFIREHNYWAGVIGAAEPILSDEEIYQMARCVVAAELQAITYREFLPVLLGPDAIPPYRGYREDVDPSIANEFATAAYRLGHSMLSPTLQRIDASGNAIAEGHIALADAFFAPQVLAATGIDPVLRGLASQRCQEVDSELTDAVRNFLFGPPGSGGLDLASLNIQRGRDHGLPGYNALRRAMGLRPARRFSDVNPDPAVAARLAAAYNDPDQIDAWVGGLAEPHAPGAMVGPLILAVVRDQFTRLRDGDRFWYQGYLSPELADLVEAQTLAAIIRRNTGIGDELPDNVFIAGTPDPQTNPAPSPSRTKIRRGKR